MRYPTYAVKPKDIRLSLLFLAALQLADIVTTARALALPGNVELNPIMASAMAHLGAGWWLPKLAIAGAAFLAARYGRDGRSKLLTSAFYTAIAITFLVVVNNLARL